MPQPGRTSLFRNDLFELSTHQELVLKANDKAGFVIQAFGDKESFVDGASSSSSSESGDIDENRVKVAPSRRRVPKIDKE